MQSGLNDLESVHFMVQNMSTVNTWPRKMFLSSEIRSKTFKL